MKVLIVGGGGREHALAWKSIQSAMVSKVYVAPGNAGTAIEQNIENVNINAEDLKGLLEFAKSNAIGLTIVGPEVPLVNGIIDLFEQHGLKCFGPRRVAAQLEGSKTFAKAFLTRHSIPTAKYGSFTDVDTAIEFSRDLALPIVIKADGLAAGKGVVIADTFELAVMAIKEMLAGNKFGNAGHRVVVEEFLQGEEASFICIVDGTDILPMASSQDHKAAYDGDTGPNTGGMGAYSPAPVIDQSMHQMIIQDVIKPTVEGLAAEGIPYTGFLYAGLMIGDDQIPRVLEFNCRFGDPETQPVMMRMKSDIVKHCLAAINGTLGEEQACWAPEMALGIVMAAKGYPDSYASGEVINGLESVLSEDIKVFHAGTKIKSKNGISVAQQNGSEIVTAGGRVLCVTALGKNISEAINIANHAVDKIQWDGSWHRNDIGYKALNRMV